MPQSVLRHGQLHRGLEVGSEAESQASPPWYKAAMNTGKRSGALAVYKGWRNWNWPEITPEFSLRHMKARVSLGGLGGVTLHSQNQILTLLRQFSAKL